MAGKFIKCALIGHPVGHSRSPAIHNHWIAQYGLRGQYDAHEVPPERLKESLLRLINEGYTGFNVTIPHKQAVMALCDEIDMTVRAIGAVNTIKVGDDGRLYGYNTDAFGFIENIRQSAPGFDFSSGAALVLGAGGAARAVAYGLQQAGTRDVRIANRTRERTEELARDFGARIIDWEGREDAAKDIALLVNTTSLGMKGQPPLEFDVSVLPERTLVNDIVYNPLETKLLRNAAAHGLKTVGGLGMLLYQAAAAFEIWFGRRPEITADLYDKIIPS